MVHPLQAVRDAPEEKRPVLEVADTVQQLDRAPLLMGLDHDDREP
jgi:hypothetical protein